MKKKMCVHLTEWLALNSVHQKKKKKKKKNKYGSAAPNGGEPIKVPFGYPKPD
jgi:hypothetical protein